MLCAILTWFVFVVLEDGIFVPSYIKPEAKAKLDIQLFVFIVLWAWGKAISDIQFIFFKQSLKHL